MDAIDTDTAPATSVLHLFKAAFRARDAQPLELLLDAAGWDGKSSSIVDTASNERIWMLNEAVQTGRPRFVRFLLERGIDISYLKKQPENVGASGIEEDGAPEENDSAASDAESHSVIIPRKSPFHRACRMRLDRTVKVFLEFGVDPNLFWETRRPGPGSWYTPLQECFRQYRDPPDHLFKCVKSLLEYGADPSMFSHGRLPIELALNRGNLDIVRILLQAGANVNQESQDSGVTALFLCTNLPMFELLIEHGADIHHRNSMGCTLLFGLAHFNTEESRAVIQRLLDIGVDINAINNVGENALLYAHRHRRKQDTSLLELFIANGVNLQQRENRTGQSILHLAWYENAPELIVNAGLDPNTKNRLDRTVLHEMIVLGEAGGGIANGRPLGGLVDIGADLEACDSNGWSPLHYATLVGDHKTTSYLLKNGANPNSRDKRGRTPAHLIGWEMHCDPVFYRNWNRDLDGITDTPYLSRVLRKWGKILVFPAIHGTVPTFYEYQADSSFILCENNQAYLAVEALSKAGADLTIKDKEGNLPFAFACAIPEFKPDLNVIYSMLQLSGFPDWCAAVRA